MKSIFLLFIFLTGIFCSVVAQQPPAAADTGQRIVQILNADRYGFIRKDSNEFQMLAGNVRMKQDQTVFYADSAVMNKNSKTVEAFGNIHINDRDSIDTYSQYLLYYVDTKVAILKKNVRLTDKKSDLFTEELEYDMNQKIGIYRNGGRVVNKASVLTSQEATYFADIKDVYFRKNVVLKDPQYTLKGDSLLYNTNTEIATFITKTTIEDSARKIITSDGFYDTKNKNAVFGKRPIIYDHAVTIIANEVETDDKTGISKLRGNALFKDTAQGIAVLGNYIESNKLTGSFFATQHPLMILKQEKDSIYITADTLYSGRLSDLERASDTMSIKEKVKSLKELPKNDSTDRYFQGYHHVRIFSDSLQAASDSLFYSGKDSVFRLFQDPIVWANESQVTGDTIYLYTKNKKADRLFVFENGLMINKAGMNMYNQIEGNRINAYFIEGDIDHMRAQGNAESVYYVKDEDSSLVGVNRASGDIIDMRFRNKELYRVVFVSEVKGTMYPINQMPESERTLRNFNWQDARRPKTKFELFGD